MAKSLMQNLRLSNLAVFRKFRNDERGVTSIEMVISSTLFLFILFWMIETGFIMLRWVMLERGVDLATRELRLFGLPESITTNEQAHAYIKGEICSETVLISDCTNTLFVELGSVNVITGLPTTSTKCVDRSGPVDPATDLPTVDDGERGEADAKDLMYLRACVVVDPILPANYAMPLPLDPTGGVALIVDNAYINEPS